MSEINLKKYVPELISDIKEFKALYDVNSKELNDINSEIVDIFNQTRISTATWGLVYWEYVFGIPTDLKLSYEERRQALIARKTGQGTTTVQKIKDVAKSYTGGEVEIIENFSDYSFVIKFVSQKGIPTNIDLFKNTIDNIKPAHLDYTIEFLYNVWNFLSENNSTWDENKTRTWNQIKNI